MKFSTTNIFLFGGLLFVIACTSPEQQASTDQDQTDKDRKTEEQNQSSQVPFVSESIKSRRIALDSARIMITAHHFQPNSLKTYCENGNFTPLFGFNIELDSIRKVIDQNGSPNPSVKKILIMPAVNAKDLNQTDPTKQTFTVILAGVDRNNRIMTSLMYEYCRPCPTDCPENYKSLLNEVDPKVCGY